MRDVWRPGRDAASSGGSNGMRELTGWRRWTRLGIWALFFLVYL